MTPTRSTQLSLPGVRPNWSRLTFAPAAGPQPELKRWPRATRLVLVVGLSASAWMGVAFFVRAIVSY